MKHINLSHDEWSFSTEPFPAFRCSLVYGRNKRDREFLPVNGIAPVQIYRVVAGDNDELYSGSDLSAAQAAQIEFNADAAKQAKAQAQAAGERCWSNPTARLQTPTPALPENQFQVIKTKEKGTLMIVSGEDTTNRCLLMVGCSGGFRGGESVLESGTTASILKNCSAGNNCESRTEVVALLEVGQSVAFHTYGRRTDDVHLYTWDGVEIACKDFSKEEWDSRPAGESKEEIEAL